MLIDSRIYSRLGTTTEETKTSTTRLSRFEQMFNPDAVKTLMMWLKCYYVKFSNIKLPSKTGARPYRGMHFLSFHSVKSFKTGTIVFQFAVN